MVGREKGGRETGERDGRRDTGRGRRETTGEGEEEKGEGGEKGEQDTLYPLMCMSYEKFLSRTFLQPNPIPVMPCTRQILVESLRTFFMCILQVLQIPFFQIGGL